MYKTHCSSIRCSFRAISLFALLRLVAVLVHADSLDDWTGVYLKALRAENTAPPLGSRNTAIYTVAVADAVNVVEHRWKPFLFTTNLTAPVDLEAVIAGAAYQVGLSLFPSRRADFDAQWQRTLTASAASPAREAGFRLGFASAATLLEARSSDGSSTQVPYIPSDKPGAWRRTPPFFRPPELPQWGRVKPFALTNGAQFRPPGPPQLGSARFASDYNEVISLGSKNSTNRTADQTQAALFWSDFSGTLTPPGHWTQITLALARSNHLATVEKVRLLALVHIALADAGIACWDAKYTYNFWRPVTVAARDDSGNPAIRMVSGWESLLPSPAFPDYVSGHSTFTGAASEVLRRWFGRDDLAFSATSETVPGVTRYYSSLTALGNEIGMSRIWGGIHFHSADVDGQELGHRIGDWVYERSLQPMATGGMGTNHLALFAGLLFIVLLLCIRGWIWSRKSGAQSR